MISCNRCGKPLETNTVFCSKCTKIHDQLHKKSTNYIGICNQEKSLTDKSICTECLCSVVCKKCGFKVMPNQYGRCPNCSNWFSLRTLEEAKCVVY